MNHNSIWEDYFKNDKQKTNQFKHIDTDILIIGAGITGLTTAYFLKDTDYKITIIDKYEIGKNAAFIYFLSIFFRISAFNFVDVRFRYSKIFVRRHF